ncbi:MAG: hypothetical protein HUU38_07115 [Anaerolineales bacterium]|nr:hypothetical protein [Anaerolineales bacterium]
MRKNLLFLFLIFSLLLAGLHPRTASLAAPFGQTSAAEQAQTLLETMTPQERIGQLFLVSFPAQDVSPNSQIYDLIVNHHIGGVILDAKNNNFELGENTLPAALSLITSLQQAEYTGTQEAIVDQATLESYFPQFVPLFVGVSQNGDGYPYDQIYAGLTELPSPMAIGATWRPELAEQVGFVAGQELSNLGFNLFLGPSLDVLADPNPDSLGDLSVRSFGGDPYWVGQMGSAYVRGIHLGSAGKMAVIAKNFPGYGGADRPPQEEVATVRKSLEQLKQIELAAFYPVTGKAVSESSTADGLLLSHIRYQGLQGNIRFTTRPITFDSQAFSTIFGLPEFTSWRDGGGLIITDDLSSRAVRRFYDPSNTSFNAWEVIRDAFLAGSDLMYVGNITSTEDEDSHASILKALDIFTQKYETDLDFQIRVDRSVLRILTLKYELYGSFTPDNVLPVEENLINIGTSDAVSLEVARQGITLLSPSIDDLELIVPNTPALSDRIIFITDASTAQQCLLCPTTSTLGAEALQQAVLRLYGLEAGSRVIRQNLFSFTFDDLQTMLDNPNSYHEIEVRMENAQWLIFSMLDIRNDRFSSQSLRRLLSDREDILQNKNVLVFAFNAPYYLDTTDISKLDAYFGMYSKSPQFLDAAARILFKEFTPTSDGPPVSVPGIEYYLIDKTLPEPSQVIPVFLDQPSPEVTTPEATPDQEPIPNLEPTPITNIKIGDVIALRTGVILDHNGHPVPDGTVVQFTFSLTGETKAIETRQGVARTTHLINGGGQLEIRAISEPALQSNPLVINIPGPEATLLPTITLTPTPTPTPSTEPTLTPTPLVTPVPTPVSRVGTDLVDWGLSFLVTLAVSLLAYRAAISIGQVRWSIRWALCAWIGGFLTYIYLALNLPGSLEFLDENGRLGIIWAILIGGAIGWVGGWLWKKTVRISRPLASPESSVPAKTKNG